MIRLKRKIAEQRLEILRMLFFKNELKTSKVAFTSEKRETLITFYQACPALWTHGNDRVQRSKYFTCIDSKIVRAV